MMTENAGLSARLHGFVMRCRCQLGKHEIEEVLSYGINIVNMTAHQYVGKCKHCETVVAYDNGMLVRPAFATVEAAKEWADRAAEDRKRLLDIMCGRVTA